MQHNFKVGDKVKVKPYSEFDFNDELYDMTDGDVFNIAGSVFTVVKIDSDGDLYLDTWDKIEYSFVIHPQDVIQTSVKNPRPHAELIKQWAEDDTIEIQARMGDGKWYDVVGTPRWDSATNYRIKPKKVTKWKWAFGDDTSDVVYAPSGYFTEDEIKEYTNFGKNFTKLEWTAKEF